MSGSLANRPIGARPRTVPPPSEGLLGRDSKLRRTDWVLWAAVLSLCLLGTLLVAAATKPKNPTHPFAGAEHQAMFVVVGLVLAVLASLVRRGWQGPVAIEVFGDASADPSARAVCAADAFRTVVTATRRLIDG